MFERTGHRLCDLNRQRSRGIVGQAVVLTGLIGKFCLQKKIGAGHHAFTIGGGQAFTDSGFEVVTALVGGVDGAEAGADGERR